MPATAPIIGLDVNRLAASRHHPGPTRPTTSPPSRVSHPVHQTPTIRPRQAPRISSTGSAREIDLDTRSTQRAQSSGLLRHCRGPSRGHAMRPTTPYGEAPQSIRGPFPGLRPSRSPPSTPCEPVCVQLVSMWALTMSTREPPPGTSALGADSYRRTEHVVMRAPMGIHDHSERGSPILGGWVRLPPPPPRSGCKTVGRSPSPRGLHSSHDTYRTR
jgi:hypothetical protein